MIGESKSMQEVFASIRQLANTDANILILGENGTGKDLVARSLLHFSPRQHAPFITIDLGSVPESLFESELFGYEKGAFTDARKAKAGRMEVASGGTLFLDEIGNLSLSMQTIDRYREASDFSTRGNQVYPYKCSLDLCHQCRNPSDGGGRYFPARLVVSYQYG